MNAATEPAATPPRPLSRTLLDSRIIAVLRACDARYLLPAAEVLVEQGIRSLEVTLTTAGGVEAISALRAALPEEAEVGAGTVLTLDDLDAVLDAGASYVVTPHTDVALCRAAVARGVVIIPGGLTPTELNAGRAAGASAVKLFPASAMGPRYVRDLHGPFPQLQVIPSGGVDRASAGEWIKVGCPAVSMGGPLLGDALRGGDLAALRERAKETVEIVTAAARAAGRG